MSSMNTQKVAIVTGSGKRRVGRCVAQALARSGYSLVIHYLTSATDAEQAVAEFQRQGVQAVALRADLSDEPAVQSLVEQVLADFGRIDVLVNCAGVWRRTPLEAITAADVRYFFEINTLGTFLICRAVGLAMVQQPTGGTIVTLGDWATLRPYVNYAAYFPSKGAIPALTRSLAVELGTRNPLVRVNCILPGPVLLPPDLPAAERQQSINSTLLKREGRPENVAQAVMHFVENDFITGVCLPVDGGRSVYAADSEE
jgi:pteridine reductase